MKPQLQLLKLGILILHGIIFIPFIPIVALRFIGICAEWFWDNTIKKIAENNWNYYHKKKTEYDTKRTR